MWFTLEVSELVHQVDNLLKKLETKNNSNSLEKSEQNEAGNGTSSETEEINSDEDDEKSDKDDGLSSREVQVYNYPSKYNFVLIFRKHTISAR